MYTYTRLFSSEKGLYKDLSYTCYEIQKTRMSTHFFGVTKPVTNVAQGCNRIVVENTWIKVAIT